MYNVVNFSDSGIDMKEIDERIASIKNNIESYPVWKDMMAVTREIYEKLKEYHIIRKIIMSPNDFCGGSINFYFTSQPESVSLKMWQDGGNPYMSLFRKMEDGFDVQLTNTFNKEGIIPLNDLDEFEQRILDYVANEIYNKNNTIVLEECHE